MSDRVAGTPLPDNFAELRTVELFGLRIAVATLEQATSSLLGLVGRDTERGYVVVTPNVAQVVQLDRDSDLKEVYRQADMALPDGMPVVWLSRLLTQPLPERVTGSDLMPALLDGMSEGSRIAVVGSYPNLQDADERLLSTGWPEGVIRVFAPPLGFDATGTLAGEMAEEVAKFGPALVFVCLGFPKQEIWALRHRHRFGGAVILCCGASLDFLVGRVQRAPMRLRQLGLEWLWRLGREPRRLWRRYAFDGFSMLRIAIRELLAKRGRRP